MLTPNMLRSTLAQELYDHDVAPFERNQERTICRIAANEIVRTWPPLIPFPTTRRQVREIAVRVKADRYRVEDLAGIVAARI
jgi:hypothetical protein